jgi:hypothetical protein
MNTSTISQQCMEMMNVKIVGDIVPPLWKKYLKIPNKPAKDSATHKPERVDQDAISILSELVYWQTPTIVRNEQTGSVVEVRQKFKADKIQKSYKGLSNYHGFNKRRVKEAIDRLADLGIVTREFRTVNTGDLVLSNVMFLEVIAQALNYISNTIPTTDPSYAITKEGVRGLGIGGTSLGGTYTENTTETTTIHSKECICASERSAQEAKDFEIQEEHWNPKDQAKPEQDMNSSNNLGPPSGQTMPETLRDQGKTFKAKAKPKKVYGPCPLKYEPYLEDWEYHTGRVFRGMNGSYTKAWKSIQKAVLGKLFNESDTPTIDSKFYTYELTPDDFAYALKNFALMRNNADYHPQDKTKIKRISLDTFFYNPYNPGQNKSYFITCLSQQPEPLIAKMKDPDPEYTDVIVDLFQKQCDMNLSNGGRKHAILCTKKLTKFFDDNKHQINYYDSQYSFIYQQVEALIDTLQRNSSPTRPIQPIYLHTDLTYNKFLPNRLKEINAMHMS